MLCDEPLRLALRNHHIDVAKTLLEAGANPNKRYFFGSEINLVSPLDLECMELLLAFGAHPNTRDRAGLTPLMKAARLPQVGWVLVGVGSCLWVRYGREGSGFWSRVRILIVIA